MKYKIKSTGQTIELEKDAFKYKGGEGAIYIVPPTAYKVCDAGKMIPESKLKELAILDHPRIVVPKDILLHRNQAVGYTMQLVPGNAKPLAEILTKAYREREGVTPQHMRQLTEQMADGIRFIHKHKGYLQVDGNEFNYMVTERHDEIYFVDVNSYQTPNFPATAIMPSIRDWHVKNVNGVHIWTELSDWYSFAILSFYMFCGIHPFKGRHPDFNNMKTLMYDQMVANKSVLDPQTQYPLGAVYHPFEDYVPGGMTGALMQWYRAIFIDNKRLIAPKDFQAMAAIISTIKQVVGSNNFNIQEIRDFLSTIVGFYERSGKEIIITKDNIHFGNKKIGLPADRFRIGFTTSKNIPFALWLDDGNIKMLNLETNTPLSINLQGNNFTTCEGKVYVQGASNIFEIEFVEQGNALIPVPKSIAAIMPHATTMFQGVVIQNVFDITIASIFPQAGHHQQFRMDELADYRITDAKYEGNILMVVGHHQEKSQYDRLVFRFDKNWKEYDVRVIENITPTGINFTVTNGICVCITEEEKVEIFSNKHGFDAIKSIDDPVIESDMKLCHIDRQVRFARGSKLYSIAVK